MTPSAYHGSVPCLACAAFPRTAAGFFWCRDYDFPGECSVFGAFRDRVAAYLYLMKRSPGDVVTIGCMVARCAGNHPWCRAVVARRCLREDIAAAVADLRLECGRSADVDGPDIVSGPAAMTVVPQKIADGLRNRAGTGQNSGFFEIDLSDEEVDAFVARCWCEAVEDTAIS